MEIGHRFCVYGYRELISKITWQKFILYHIPHERGRDERLGSWRKRVAKHTTASKKSDRKLILSFIVDNAYVLIHPPPPSPLLSSIALHAANVNIKEITVAVHNNVISRHNNWFPFKFD